MRIKYLGPMSSIETGGVVLERDEATEVPDELGADLTTNRPGNFEAASDTAGPATTSGSPAIRRRRRSRPASEGSN